MSFSSNGDGFVFHDRTGVSAEKEASLGLDSFPPPGQLWATYCAWKGLSPTEEELVLQDYFDDGSGKEPRYYQRTAINATIEAIAKGRDRGTFTAPIVNKGANRTRRSINLKPIVPSGAKNVSVLPLIDRWSEVLN